MNKVDLSKYNNSSYNPGRNFLVRTLWYYTNIIFFKSAWLPVYSVKRLLLRLFGAKLGRGVVIKPSVNIKYPWRLEIGNNVWIGENVWIDNLADVRIGNNVVLSQGAMLLTGSHDFTKTTFDVIVGQITLEDGVWIGAKAIVTPSVTCHSHSVLSVGSVALRDLEPYFVYHGNPAMKVMRRQIY